ncbi:probable fructose-2,6-bisphosphatase TIGAR A [Syngnathoides biaculeatus]|uniref:probable fructose-2,6-bisphosphatase TIGAR A n=1 Tax=Syngnathoides biaculeatus TaxID=300417 RepID=UPI002ADE8154|nr:probable fructose-2,6-bisphosphatase TIGAR A [Syngnathoides biaculeatus]
MKSLRLGLTFVRHGETQFNKEGLLQGQAIDGPLSEVGLQQAEAAGHYLKDVKFSNLFVSDMLRARQTAETIVKHNSSCAGLQLVCDPLLKEKSFGIAEGKRVQEAKDMAKAAGQSFATFTPLHGETQEQVKQRVKEFWLKMVQQVWREHQLNRSDNERSSAPQLDGEEADDFPAHALVVSHGAYLCVTMRFLVDDLHCPVPDGCSRGRMFSLSPNAGVSRFVLTLMKEDDEAFKVSHIQCLFVNKGDHIKT